MSFEKTENAEFAYIQNDEVLIPAIIINNSNRFQQIYDTVTNRRKINQNHVLDLSIKTIINDEKLKIVIELIVKDSNIQDWFVFDAIEHYTFVKDILEAKIFCISNPIGYLFVYPPKHNEILKVTNQIKSYLASGVK